MGPPYPKCPRVAPRPVSRSRRPHLACRPGWYGGIGRISRARKEKPPLPGARIVLDLREEIRRLDARRLRGFAVHSVQDLLDCRIAPDRVPLSLGPLADG